MTEAACSRSTASRRSMERIFSLLVLLFVLSAHALPAPARRFVVRPRGVLESRHAGLYHPCKFTCLRGGQDGAKGEEEENGSAKDGSAEQDERKSAGEEEDMLSADAEVGQEEAEQGMDAEMAKESTPVHRAAFGIRVPNELAALAVNLLISIGCTFAVAFLQSGYLYRGQAPPNARALSITYNMFVGVSSVQFLIVLHKVAMSLAPLMKDVYRDVVQARVPPKTKEEAMARRRRQRIALRAMRTISTILFMALYRARGRTSRRETAGEAGEAHASAAAAAASLSSSFSLLKSMARSAWIYVLEKIFMLVGDELALLGLYAAEGKELTDEQKARIAELVKEQEEREAAENGEHDAESKEEEEGESRAADGGGAGTGMEERKPGLEGLFSGIGSIFNRGMGKAAGGSSSLPLREEEEEDVSGRRDSCPVESRGGVEAAPALRGHEDKVEATGAEEEEEEEVEEEASAGPDLSLRKGEEEAEEGQGEVSSPCSPTPDEEGRGQGRRCRATEHNRLDSCQGEHGGKRGGSEGASTPLGR
eukprot:756384-Hanusia_phi.AAC.2